jgi:hypothetical protein
MSRTATLEHQLRSAGVAVYCRANDLCADCLEALKARGAVPRSAAPVLRAFASRMFGGSTRQTPPRVYSDPVQRRRKMSTFKSVHTPLPAQCRIQPLGLLSLFVSQTRIDQMAVSTTTFAQRMERSNRKNHVVDRSGAGSCQSRRQARFAQVGLAARSTQTHQRSW